MLPGYNRVFSYVMHQLFCKFRSRSFIHFRFSGRLPSCVHSFIHLKNINVHMLVSSYLLSRVCTVFADLDHVC